MGWSVVFVHVITFYLVDLLAILLLDLWVCLFVPYAVASLGDHLFVILSFSRRAAQIA